MPALPPGACVGLFGKLPARGDFVRENLPRDFTDAWDAWWLRGLAYTQLRPREEWCAAWLEAPVWRFLLPPGLCGRNGVLGLWLPSVDKAGRYYPLTIAAAASDDWAPYAGRMTDALTAWEQAGRDTLEHDLAPAELLLRIQDAFAASDPRGPSMDFAPAQATWWTEGGPRVVPRVEGGSALPEGIRFAALIDDDWISAVQSAEPITLPSGPGDVQP
ncbi:MAG: type VI secretion system-associated protein TagF [Proteobacteria bacterium]|nr:type VI secretion system-associated protein TagF [Pseudomonadota bacterium]